MNVPTSNQFKLAVIGEAMAEISGKPFSAMPQGVGGDIMNTAIYLKKLLPDNNVISFVTAMGTDVLSKAIIDKWQAFQLDTSKVLINEEKQVGMYYVHNDESGERYFQYWRNDSAARYMMQHDKIQDVLQSLDDYDAVFLSGVSLAILPDTDKNALIEQLEVLSSGGVKIIFDGNYRPKLWQNHEQARACYEKLYKVSDLALVTFEDEQQLWRDQDVQSCRLRLAKYGIKELIIKDGAKGCVYISGQQTTSVPTQVVKKVVDTTAAGDSFNAGFLAGWFSKKTPTISCTLGNKLAGQVIQKRGAIVEINVEPIYQSLVTG